MMRMLILYAVLALFSVNSSAFETDNAQELSQIKAFHQVSENLASSGTVDIEHLAMLKAAGFKHIVGLVPGDYSGLTDAANKLGITYHHIPVEWKAPQLADFQKMLDAIGTDNKQKTLIHCKLNWRASSFTYLYRVTQLAVPEAEAEQDLLKIWKPHQGWDTFITNTKAHYAQ
jgi:protein tyrosine phosphatase (PTP) superfamily phosphohydrolase (DUF442 family)